MLKKIFGEGDEKLIKIALTHPSYTKENNISDLENYERLEFFGDSVLKLFTSKLLYEVYPKSAEGELSKIRSILVSDAILAKVAVQIGLDKLIILGPSEEKQGGRKRESNIACSLEAILGAYYFSGKREEIENFIRDYIIVYAEDVDKHFEKYNAKDILQQYTQGYNKTRPDYNVVSVSGPAHKPIFTVEVVWEGKVIASANGSSKKEAEQNGAYEACKSLDIIK
jgi:ribonuclease-3